MSLVICLWLLSSFTHACCLLPVRYPFWAESKTFLFSNMSPVKATFAFSKMLNYLKLASKTEILTHGICTLLLGSNILIH